MPGGAARGAHAWQVAEQGPSPVAQPNLLIHGRGLRNTFRQMSIHDSSPSHSSDAACVAKGSHVQTELTRGKWQSKVDPLSHSPKS